LIEINISNQLGNNRNPSITAIRQTTEKRKDEKQGNRERSPRRTERFQANSIYKDEHSKSS
jgi:hypothetical protein